VIGCREAAARPSDALGEDLASLRQDWGGPRWSAWTRRPGRELMSYRFGLPVPPVCLDPRRTI